MDDFSIAEQKLVETLERFDNAASQVLFLIEKYEQRSNMLATEFQRKLESSTYQQQNEVNNFIEKQLTEKLKQFQTQIDDASKNFNHSANILKIQSTHDVTKGKKILLWIFWLSGIALLVNAIWGVGSFYYFSDIIKSKKQSAEIATLLNEADIVRCGDALCAKANKKAKQNNGYFELQKR